jgi:hypothetical protein
MTYKEAKDLTLLKWRFRRDHPGKRLPEDIMVKIIVLPAACPLCELFGEADCYGCPLVINNLRCGAGVFRLWSEAERRGDRDAASHFAGEIVNRVEKWEAREPEAVPA